VGLVESLVALVRGLTPEGSLASRTARSGIWVTATNVGVRVLQTVLWIFLARLLGPESIGLMGIAMVTLVALNRFSELGIDTALVQREEADVDGYLDTAWSLSVGRGLLLGGVTFLAAPLLAGVFGDPQVTDILRVIALSPVLMGLRNPGIVYFKKDLQFHRNFAHRVGGALTEFVVSIALALAFGTVWALVVGYLAGNLALVVGSYLLHDYRPSLSFDGGRARTLVDYGKWITGSSVVYFLITDGDDFVVGALLSSTALGYYQLAYRVANAPATEVTSTISSVVFPAYSKLQGDLAAFRDAYFTTLRVTALVSLPMAVGIVVVAPSFVAGVLGPEWTPMTTTMQLIAVYGLLHSIAATLGPVWNARGRPDIGLKVGLARLVVIAVLIVPAIRGYGIEGAAGVVVLAYLFPALPLDLYLVTRELDTTARRFLRELGFPLLASLAMGGAVLALQSSVAFPTPVTEFAASVALGVGVYVVAVLLIERYLRWGIEPTLRRLVGAVQG